MADRFWINTTSGNWNDINNWSASSGGLGGAGVPGAADNAIFDSAAAGTCVVDVSPSIISLNTTGFVGTIDNATNNISYTLSESLTIDTGVTWTKGTGTITFSTGSSANIDTNGKFLEDIVSTKVGGLLNIISNLDAESILINIRTEVNVTANVTLGANGGSGNFINSNTSTGNLSMGSGTWTIYGDFDVHVMGGTILASTSTVIMNGSSKNFYIKTGATMYNVVINGAIYLIGTFNLNDLTLNASSFADNANHPTLTFSGSLVINSSAGWLKGNGTLTFIGTGTTTNIDPNGKILEAVVSSKVGGLLNILSSLDTVSFLINDRTELNVDGNVTTSDFTNNSSSGDMYMGTGTWTMSGNFNTNNLGGVIVPETSTIIMNGASKNLNIKSGHTINDLIINGTVYITNNVSIKNLTLNAGSAINNSLNPSLTISGSLVINAAATWVKGTGIINLNGTADDNLDVNGKSIEVVQVVKPSGRLTILTSLTVERFYYGGTGTLTITTGITLTTIGYLFVVRSTDATIGSGFTINVGGDLGCATSINFHIGSGSTMNVYGNVGEGTVGRANNWGIAGAVDSVVNLLGVGKTIWVGGYVYSAIPLVVETGASYTFPVGTVFYCNSVTVKGSLLSIYIMQTAQGGGEIKVAATGQITGYQIYLYAQTLGITENLGLINVSEIVFDLSSREYNFYPGNYGNTTIRLVKSGSFDSDRGIYTQDGDYYLGGFLTNSSRSGRVKNTGRTVNLYIKKGILNTSGGLVWYKGLGTLTFESTGSYTIEPQAYENVVINKSSGISLVGNTSFDSLTVTSGDFDANDFNVTINPGNFSATTAGTIYCGNGTWTLYGDLLTASLVGSFTREGSTFVFKGASKTIAAKPDASVNFNNVTIDTGASYNLTSVSGVVTVLGTLIISGSLNVPVSGLATEGDVQVKSGGLLSGGLWRINASGISEQSGTVTVTSVDVYFSIAASVFVAGVYQSEVVFRIGGTKTFTFTAGTYAFNSFIATGTGSLTLKADVNNPNFSIAGVFNNSGATWVKGTGTITFTGTGDIIFYTNAQTYENIVVNKNSGVTLSGNLNADSLTISSGDFNAAGFTVTTNPGGITITTAGTVTGGSGTWTCYGDYSATNAIVTNAANTPYVIKGNLTIDSSVTWTRGGSNSITLNGPNNISIDTNDKIIDLVSVAKDSGYTATLLSSLRPYRFFISGAGNFDANDFDITTTYPSANTGVIDIAGSGNVYMGNGTWTITNIGWFNTLSKTGSDIHSEGSTVTIGGGYLRLSGRIQDALNNIIIPAGKSIEASNFGGTMYAKGTVTIAGIFRHPFRGFHIFETGDLKIPAGGNYNNTASSAIILECGISQMDGTFAHVSSCSVVFPNTDHIENIVPAIYTAGSFSVYPTGNKTWKLQAGNYVFNGAFSFSASVGNTLNIDHTNNPNVTFNGGLSMSGEGTINYTKGTGVLTLTSGPLTTLNKELEDIVKTTAGAVTMGSDLTTESLDLTAGIFNANDFDITIDPGDLTIRNGATFESGAGIHELKEGDLILEATSVYNTDTIGQIKFTGTSDQKINTANVSDYIDAVTVDKPSGEFLFETDLKLEAFYGVRGNININNRTIQTRSAFDIDVNADIVPVTSLDGCTLNVGGTVTFNGLDGDLLDLKASAEWYLNVSGGSVASYVDVANSNASGGNSILVNSETSVDSGGNINWLFAVLATISKLAPARVLINRLRKRSKLF